MIAQIAEAIGRALGFATSGRPLEAQGELDAAWSASIGLRRADVQRLDVGAIWVRNPRSAHSRRC